MISSLNPSTQQFLNDLNQIGDSMQQAQNQVTTGLKVSQVSDQPDVISTLLATRASLSTSQQISTNLGSIKTETDSGEQALQSAVTLFDQVQTLGASGVTSTSTAATNATLAQQAGSVLQEVVGLADTNEAGRYIFSGDADQQAPYTVDLTQTPPVSAYQGSAATRVAQHPDGSTFAISLTAQTIFDSSDPTTNVFSAITSLQTALANNDTAGIQAANAGLSKIGDYLNQQLAFYGNVQDKVAQATDYASTQQTQLQTQIANLQDADLTGSILTLNQDQTQEQAALQSEARIPRTTLFDFLA
jgi:flagellar hook-associated protein 3 FlgL